MKKYKSIGMTMCLFIAVIIPPNNQSNASITHAINDEHFTYPMPKKKPSKESIKKLYERNKNIFFTEYKSIRYAEITPEKISPTLLLKYFICINFIDSLSAIAACFSFSEQCLQT